MSNSKKLGVCIDGIIRNKFDKFDELYRKKYIKNSGLVSMSENFEPIEDEESDSEDKRIENLINEKIHLPMTTYDLTMHYEFDSIEDFQKFIDEEYVMELNASSPIVRNSMDSLNRIQFYGEHHNINTYLICNGNEQAVTATFHFLTKNTCRIKNIAFRNFDEKLWNEFDIIITDVPEILDNKPEHKITIKINQEYNKLNSANYNYNSLKEAMEEFPKIIDQIEKN